VFYGSAFHCLGSGGVRGVFPRRLTHQGHNRISKSSSLLQRPKHLPRADTALCRRPAHANREGNANGNDLTAGMFVWSDGSAKELKRTILHNMAMVPGMDGDLKPADLDAVAAYVWAISHQLPLL
jgi:hypothetical protein